MHGGENPNQLIVEDNDLLLVIAYLMRHRIKGWPTEGTSSVPVYIRKNNSAGEVLDSDFLGPMLKQATVKALGVVVDADDQIASRWSRLSSFAKAHGISVPAKCPAAGFVATTKDGKRFGGWIMPDNQSPGMLETLCRSLVPADLEDLWKHAVASTDEAKKHGADYHDLHIAKARVHTWLSWRNPPGERLGTAIGKKLLDPHATATQGFMNWFKTLYGLEEVSTV